MLQSFFLVTFIVLIGLWTPTAGAEELLTVAPDLFLAASPDTPPPEGSVAPAPETKKPSFWRDKFKFSGVLRQETAFRVVDSEQFNPNFSKIKEYVEMDFRFLFNDTVHLKIGGRAWYDAVYDLTNQYPSNVNDQMRKEVALRDFYLDIFGPKIQARLGHQQIVWGEALAQFFADVVNPQDLREFILPDFEYIRLPIWAIDLKYYYLPNATLELVASPDQTVDKLALPGADFSFFPNPNETFTINPIIPGVPTVLLSEKVPPLSIAHWNGGARMTFLTHGWDLSALFYTTTSHAPAVFKTLALDTQTGQGVLLLNPVHNRVYDFGLTFSKNVKSNILRGEFVFTKDQYFNSDDVLFGQGVVLSNAFRYVLGFDTSLGGVVDMVSEFQQQVIAGNNNLISDPSVDSWIALHFETGLLNEKLVPELDFVVGLRKGDTLIRPRIGFFVTDTVLLSWGADIFTGPTDSLYGQFNDVSRVYMNTQWSY